MPINFIVFVKYPAYHFHSVINSSNFSVILINVILLYWINFNFPLSKFTYLLIIYSAIFDYSLLAFPNPDLKTIGFQLLISIHSVIFTIHWSLQSNLSFKYWQSPNLFIFKPIIFKLILFFFANLIFLFMNFRIQINFLELFSVNFHIYFTSPNFSLKVSQFLIISKSIIFKFIHIVFSESNYFLVHFYNFIVLIKPNCPFQWS